MLNHDSSTNQEMLRDLLKKAKSLLLLRNSITSDQEVVLPLIRGTLLATATEVRITLLLVTPSTEAGLLLNPEEEEEAIET